MAPYRLHILVCNDSDCAAKGSKQLYDTLRQMIKDRNLTKDVKVSQTTCLDDCEYGPNVLVYPQGMLYNSVDTERLKTILDASLQGKPPTGTKHRKMIRKPLGS